jgi:hypothetical protein
MVHLMSAETYIHDGYKNKSKCLCFLLVAMFIDNHVVCTAFIDSAYFTSLAMEPIHARDAFELSHPLNQQTSAKRRGLWPGKMSMVA